MPSGACLLKYPPPSPRSRSEDPGARAGRSIHLTGRDAALRGRTTTEVVDFDLCDPAHELQNVLADVTLAFAMGALGCPPRLSIVTMSHARYLRGAGIFGLVFMLASGFLRFVGFGVAAGPFVIRWHYFGLAALFAFAVMAILATRRWVQVLGVAGLVALLSICMVAGCALLLSGALPSLPTRRIEAPGGQPYSVVVRESRDWIDPLYEISVDSSWPVGLSWSVGCVNGDYQDLVDLTWRSPTELAVTVDSGDGDHVVVVSVSKMTGRIVSRVPAELHSC